MLNFLNIIKKQKYELHKSQHIVLYIIIYLKLCISNKTYLRKKTHLMNIVYYYKFYVGFSNFEKKYVSRIKIKAFRKKKTYFKEIDYVTSKFCCHAYFVTRKEKQKTFRNY